jgi:hypothetical protein
MICDELNRHEEDCDFGEPESETRLNKYACKYVIASNNQLLKSIWKVKKIIILST